MKFNAYKLRVWSIRVRRRDKVCQVCGSRESGEAHHLFDKSTYPELAYVASNGVRLCGSSKKTGNDCHAIFHNVFMGGTKYSCTTEDFDTFQLLVTLARNFQMNEIKLTEVAA